jgi:hypothetical protein
VCFFHGTKKKKKKKKRGFAEETLPMTAKKLIVRNGLQQMVVGMMRTTIGSQVQIFLSFRWGFFPQLFAIAIETISLTWLDIILIIPTKIGICKSKTRWTTVC